LRKTGHGETLIRDTIERAGIASGLKAGEAAGIVRTLERMDKYRFKDSTIRAWVGLTGEEAAAIGWDRPSRDWSKAARAEGRGNKAERIGKRRELVREYVRTIGGQYWTLRTLRAWLDARGEHAANQTLLKDLAALGIETPGQTDKTPAPLSLFGSA